MKISCSPTFKTYSTPTLREQLARFTCTLKIWFCFSLISFTLCFHCRQHCTPWRIIAALLVLPRVYFIYRLTPRNYWSSFHLPSSSQEKHSPSSEHSLRPGQAELTQKLAYLSRQCKSVVSVSILSHILYTNARIFNFKRFLATDLRKEEAGTVHAQHNNSWTSASFRSIISETATLKGKSLFDTKCLLLSFLFEIFFVVFFCCDKFSSHDLVAGTKTSCINAKCRYCFPNFEILERIDTF